MNQQQQQQQQNNNNNEMIEMFLDSASSSTIQPQQQQQQPQPIQTVTTATTTAGTTASPYIIQNGNIYQLTANNQLISRNTIQLNQIQSASAASALNDQQQQSAVPPKQIIINPCTQLNNRIKMTTIKNGSPTTFLNLNTSKGKVIYRTQPISTNTTTNISDQTTLRTINIQQQQQQQQQQQSSPKQIIISNSNANTSRLSALINSSSPPTSLNKTQPSIIVLAANNLQPQQKPISLIAKTPIVEQQQQQQPNLKPLNSLKQVAITNSNNNNNNNNNNTNGGVQFYLSNSAPTTVSTPHINNSNTQFTIQVATASDKQPQQNEIETNSLIIKNEQIESHSIADSNQFILQGNQVASSNLQTILANNNNNSTPTLTAAATLAGKAKNQKELVKITPIAVQPKSANKIQSILNRPVTTFLTTTATSTLPPPAPAPIPLSVNMAAATNCNLSNNNQQTNKTTVISRQQQHQQQQQQQTAISNNMTNESQTNNQNKSNQAFIKIAAKSAQAQTQLQSQPQQSDENIMPSESILNELILPDTRIFASLLNKDSNAAAAASTAAAASCSLNQKDLANNKRVLTDLTYKTILIGNCEHIILDNVHNLADFRGDFTKLKNLASAVANRFNKPVTIPAFLLIENKLSLEKVKECLNEKQIHPIIIETSSTSTSNLTPQNNNKTTHSQTNQTNKQFKEQNQHIIQTLNKQTSTVLEQQPQPQQQSEQQPQLQPQPQQIIATNTITSTKKSNASSSAKRINTIGSSSGENVTSDVLAAQKKIRKPKTCKAVASGAANAKFVSSLANELLSAANAGAASTSTANNTPVKLQDQLSTSTANISGISSSTQSTHLLNQSANLINVSNMSVNQILKLEQQQQQQQQNQNSDQLLNSFISEVNNQQMNNCLIKKEIKIEQVPLPSANELIGYNEQLQNQVSYDMLIASNNQMDLIQQQQQQQQQQALQLQEPNQNNHIYIQQTHDQMVDISQNNNYIIQQQQQPVTFTNQANDYDFNFDPFDSNALFNLNEMEFI